jgi:hypothetical protein
MMRIVCVLLLFLGLSSPNYGWWRDHPHDYTHPEIISPPPSIFQTGPYIPFVSDFIDTDMKLKEVVCDIIGYMGALATKARSREDPMAALTYLDVRRKFDVYYREVKKFPGECHARGDSDYPDMQRCQVIGYFLEKSQHFREGEYPTVHKDIDDSIKMLKSSFKECEIPK